MAGTKDLLQALNELREARGDYDLAEKMYDGTVEELFISDRVKELVGKANAEEMERFNFASIPVDALADKLKLASIVASSDDQTLKKKAQKALDDVWHRNEMFREFNSTNRKACKLGDGYLFVWPVKRSEGDVIAVDMLYNDPRTVRAIYDPDNQLRIKYVIKSWEETEDGKKSIFVNLYYRDRFEFWVCPPGKQADAIESWEEVREKLENPYGELPYFHFRNDGPHGYPVHRRAYGPQHLINKLIVELVGAIDFHSLPQRYYLVDPKVDDPGGQGPDFDEDEELDDATEGRFRADPGYLWRLVAKAVGEFQSADPEVFLKPFDRTVRSMAQLTGTPFHYFDPTGDSPSGESLKTANAPLNDKAGSMAVMLGNTWDEAFTFALDLLGHSKVDVALRWQPMETATDKEGWETVSQKQDAGVPQRDALIEAGYREEVVDGWLSGDDFTFTKRLALLQQVGQTIQQLGQGVALNVVTEQQVQAIITQFLGELSPGDEDED